MPREFLDHAQAEDGLLHGVMQDVQADQSGIQIPVRGVVRMLEFRLRHSITIDDSIKDE